MCSHAYLWKLGVQPCFQIIEDWFCLVLPDLTPFVRPLAPRLFLNDVKLGDAPYRLFCNDGALRFVYVDELAADGLAVSGSQ